MKIENLNHLKKLIRLCRSEGVQAIKIDGIEIGLGPEPYKAAKAKPFSLDLPPEAAAQITVDEIETDELTEEQLLFYSSDAQAQ